MMSLCFVDSAWYEEEGMGSGKVCLAVLGYIYEYSRLNEHFWREGTTASVGR